MDIIARKWKLKWKVSITTAQQSPFNNGPSLNYNSKF